MHKSVSWQEGWKHIELAQVGEIREIWKNEGRPKIPGGVVDRLALMIKDLPEVKKETPSQPTASGSQQTKKLSKTKFST